VLTDDDETTPDAVTHRKYYYTGSAVLFVADSSDNKLIENILTPGGETLLSARYEKDEQSGNCLNGYYTFNTDIRGSITNILNNTGSFTTGYVYDEFGNQIKTDEQDFLNEATYTGAIYDEESELYYLNSRYYNSNTGQFTTRDTYLGNIYNPATHNLYTYTSNNPVNFVDPTGHAGYHWAIAAGLVVVAAVAVVLTAGGTLPAVAAVTSVLSGTAAVTTASTIASGTFIAASTSLGFTALDAAAESKTIHEFAEKGNWKTVTSTALSGVFGGLSSFIDTKSIAKNATNKVSGSIKGTPKTIKTPYGEAIQSTSADAMKVRQYVDNGGQLYRGGTFGRSNVTDAQFWATENPLNPGYANKYGIDFSKIDYIIGGKQIPGTPYITRPAPALGNNVGGGIEIVNNPNSVKLDFFYMP